MIIGGALLSRLNYLNEGNKKIKEEVYGIYRFWNCSTDIY